MFTNFTKLFNKGRSNSTEAKSYPALAGTLSLGWGNSFTFANNNVKWMQYYTTVAPVGDAINKIADKGSKIPLMLFASDSNEAEMPITNHPFLALLKRPNPNQTQQQFIKEALVHERATGNHYVRLMGLINGDVLSREPVELYNLRPDLITVSGAFINGRPTYYQYNNPDGSIATFNYRLVKDAQGNFVEAYIESNGFSQLYHFKNICTRNYNGYYYNVYGDAPLQSAEIQIGQYFEAALYNYFLIVNGLSARKIISSDSKEPFTQAQKDALKKFIEEMDDLSESAKNNLFSNALLSWLDLKAEKFL